MGSRRGERESVRELQVKKRTGPFLRQDKLKTRHYKAWLYRLKAYPT